MKSAGVIGWPVAHSQSPLIHRFWLAKLGLDGDYGRFAVRPGQLGEAIRALPALGLAGVNVTVPHKVAVMAHLDRVDDLAAKVGAVNTVVVEDGALVGYNTDVQGITSSLGDPLTMRHPAVAVIGSGGAARSALAHLAALDRSRAEQNLYLEAYDRLDSIDTIIVARNADKSNALLAEFGLDGRFVDITDEASLYWVDVVINASSLGMIGSDKMPSWLVELPEDMAHSSQNAFCLPPIVFDMVYAPLETPLLAAARARGLRTIDGLAMLIGQAAAAFELFFGAPAPRGHDAELRALLVAALEAKPL